MADLTDAEPACSDRPPAGHRLEEVWGLVTRAQQGDGEAFGLLFRRYYGMVFGLLLSRGADHHLAEDLTSETFARAYAGIGKLKWQNRDPIAWLGRIALNLLSSYKKPALRRLEFCVPELYGWCVPEPYVAGLQQELTARAVRRAMRLLSETERCYVTELFLHGLTVSDISRATGKWPWDIEKVRDRAVRRLRSSLQEFAP